MADQGKGPKTFRARIFWSFIPIILVLFGLVTLFGVQQQTKLVEEEFEKRGREMASSLAHASELGVLAESKRTLESPLRGVSSDPDVTHVLVYAESGRVIAGAGTHYDAHASALPDAPELSKLSETTSREIVLAGGVGSLEFIAPIFSEAVRTPDEELLGGIGGERSRRVVGAVRLGLSRSALDAHTSNLIGFWIAAAALFIAAAAIAIYALSARITRPIIDLMGSVQRVAEGSLTERIPVTSRDEVGRLASSFNEMSTALEQTAAEKERVLADLEDRKVQLEDQTVALEHSLQEARSTAEVIRVLNSSLDLGQVLDTVAREAVKVAEADACGIVELDSPRATTRFLGSQNLSDSLLKRASGVSASLREQLSERIASRGRAFQIADVSEFGSAELESFVGADGLRAMLGIPIRRGPVLLAILLFRKASGTFGARAVEAVQTLADQSGVAVEKARLFEEVEEKGRLLEVANQHKSEFLANMSHELRTPLNAIIGFSEVLLEKVFGELNEKQEEYLQDVFSSGHHLLSLINDILDLSKIEAGRMELDAREFDLPTMVDNAAMLVRQRATRHGVTLSAEVDPRLGVMVADERLVKQVLVNLLSNAVKFTPEGGRVAVLAELTGGATLVSVTDTGVGIPPDDQRKIFDEFRQVGPDAHVREGTGLGLTLARKFVQLHGGEIGVESEVGRGSRFWFTIPNELPLPASDDPAAPTDAAEEVRS